MDGCAPGPAGSRRDVPILVLTPIHEPQAIDMATPVTILTGFLGSGKTTLLKRILNEQHGMKIAVIENEFGEENIDNEILVQDTNEQIIQMSNGCICCTIRGDLARAAIWPRRSATASSTSTAS
jgi:ABC-type polar amino acid transport system ATPase subunit